MRRFTQLGLLVGAGALLGACNFFSQPADLQTESLQNELAQTQIAAVRATATVNADRLMITLENAQTAVSGVDLQSTRIASTLIAQGMPLVDTSAITPLVPTEAPQSGSPIPHIVNPLLTPIAPQVNGQGSAQGDSSLVRATPTVPFVQSTIDPNGPSLTSVSLTEQVGSDDCPVQPSTSFSTSAAQIYVTAVANHVQAGTTISASFTHDGQQVVNYPWTPDFDINGACIWFNMPSSDVNFAPGKWAVELSINGTPIGAPLPFSISGDTPVQINITPEVGS